MYKILIRNREKEAITNPRMSKYSIFHDIDDNEYKTSELSEVLSTANKLLDRYLRKDIMIVDQIEVESKVSTTSLKTINITSDLVAIVNDGSNFVFKLDLSSLNDYTIVNVEKSKFELFKEYLEGLGLTDVELTNTFEITAKNPTGEAVVGIYGFQEGMFTLYSRQTSMSNYITSAFTTTLDTKGSGTIIEPTTNKYINLFFTDEDNQPLIVDKIKLFYRNGNSSFDKEYIDVSEIHTVVNNTGKYLIEVEKEGYAHDPYYEVEFTSNKEDAITIVLTKDVVNELLDDINGEVI